MRRANKRLQEPIGIENAQRSRRLFFPLIRQRAKIILRLLSKNKKYRLTPRTQVNFRFVGNPEIQKWHRDYFGDPAPTDVISFPMRGKNKGEKDLLGDVVISVDTARRQARQFGKTFEEELTLYMIHGVLHLLGYDDQSRAKKKVMDRLQFSLLDKVMRRK